MYIYIFLCIHDIPKFLWYFYATQFIYELFQIVKNLQKLLQYTYWTKSMNRWPEQLNQCS